MSEPDEAMKTLLQRAERLEDSVEAYKLDLARADDDRVRAIKGIEDAQVALVSVEQAISILNRRLVG